MDMQDRSSEKMRKDDRIIVLKVIDGKKPINSTGLVDNRLFTGENYLHAIRQSYNGLWVLKYEQGSVPGALKQSFTKFSDLLAFCTGYFNKRNIEIVEVRD